MDEDSTGVSLSSEDLAFLRQLRQRRTEGVLLPPLLPMGPSPPAGVATGADIKSFLATLDEGALDRVIKLFVMPMVAGFKTEEQIREIVRNENEKWGLSEKHAEEQAEAIRSLTKWHKWGQRVIAGLAGTVATGLVYWGLRKLGVPLPQADQ